TACGFFRLPWLPFCAWVVLAVTVWTVGLMGLGALLGAPLEAAFGIPAPLAVAIPIVVLALAGAAAMIVTKCLRTDEAMSALESSTLLLLVGTIPVGLAMESTGLVMTIVNGLIGLIGTSNLVLFLAVFYIITASLTEILSNNAVAVLLTPVALSLATTLDVSPLPLLVAVLFGASAAFMTPFGYQTNAIVMGPGGYKFVDYLRLGFPLQLIMITVATIFIPLFWPF
ncbi:MAG: anion permease, partial [Caldilineaceae bacterium]|nr:anion permease [Caldilineaceae bacterium]